MTPLVLGVVTTIAITVLAMLCSLLLDAWIGRVEVTSIVTALSVMAVAAVIWLVATAALRPELTDVPVAVAAAMAGLGAVLVSATSRMGGLPFWRGLIFAALYTAVVFTPVAISLFSLGDGLLGAELAALDLAGALPVLIAAGGGSAAILVLARRTAGPEAYVSAGPLILLPILLAIWVLWVAWMVGLESAIDDATPRIVASGIVAPIAAAVVWLIVQRALHARTTVVGLVGGLFCGMASIAPAAAYLDVVGAVLTGAIAGAVCSVTGYALVRRTKHPAWMLAVALALGAGLGTGLLGAFATRSGLMFTGQPEVLFSQFASVLLVLAWSFCLTAACWFLVTRGPRRGRPALTRNRSSAADVQ